MKVFHQLADIPSEKNFSSIAIGNFDGVHLGHQILLGSMLESAQHLFAASTVLTFYPHPVEVLKPGVRLERLTTTSEKLSLLEKMGVSQALVEPFTNELSQLSAEDFFKTYLVGALKARSLHVGFDFRFGKNREGDTLLLKKLCENERSGIELTVHEPFTLNSEKVSSSLIREYVKTGDFERARRLLGRPYFLSGQVRPGAMRGRTLGFPTANLQFSSEKAVPQKGVYVTRAIWQKQAFRSITNVGFRPTFEPSEAAGLTVEVHLLNFGTRIYDEKIRLEFFEKIRDEKRFESGEALRVQIQEDIKRVETYPFPGE